MKRRFPLAAATAAVLLGILTGCSLNGSSNPVYHDKAASAGITAVMTATAPPACHVLGDDKQQLALVSDWPNLGKAHIESAQPALSSNPEHYAPQYRCIYGPDAEVSEYELSFGVATAAEKPGSHKLFDSVVERWRASDTRVNYGDVFHHTVGLSSANQRRLAQAQAYVTKDDYLLGVAFQCKRAADSVTVVNRLLLGRSKLTGNSDLANAAAAQRLNRLVAAELRALHCK